MGKSVLLKSSEAKKEKKKNTTNFYVESSM